MASGERFCAVCFLGAGMTSFRGVEGFVPPLPEALEPAFPSLEILRLVGRGGMGAVYEARQLALERTVALKILPSELASNPEFEERFKREAQALAKLSHPSIVAIYETGKSLEGHLYIVMEYVEGRSLGEVLKSEDDQSQPAPEALTYARQAAEALACAHEQGIVHRDIKPSNLLIGDDGRLRVVDFGLALLGQVMEESELTRSHTTLGTLSYMAPEQKLGQADARSDLYSLGVVFYQMLTGRLPEGAFEPPSAIMNGRGNKRLDLVVLHLLKPDPRDRVTSAASFIDRLDQLERKRLPLGWLAAAALGVLTTGLLAIKPWQGSETEQASKKRREQGLPTWRLRLPEGEPVTEGALVAPIRLTALIPQSRSYFGTAIATAGDILLVSHPGNNVMDRETGQSGELYVYQLGPDGECSAPVVLTADKPIPNDGFSAELHVAPDAQTLVCTSFLPVADSLATRAHVTLFEREEPTKNRWRRSNVIATPFITEESVARITVQLDTGRLAIGVPDDPEGGYVLVYDRSPDKADWLLAAKLTVPDINAKAQFGWLTSFHRGGLIGSAFRYNAGIAFRRGALFSFDRMGNLAELPIDDPDGITMAYFGFSFAISGDDMVVGAPGEAFGATLGPGSVRFFDYDSAKLRWQAREKLRLPGDAVPSRSAFGHWVTMKDDRMAALAVLSDRQEEVITNAFLYKRDAGGRWTSSTRIQCNVISQSTHEGSKPTTLNFGRMVFGEDFFAISAPTDTETDGGLVGSGAVYVYPDAVLRRTDAHSEL